MTSREISEQLLRIAKADNLVGELYKLTDAWSAVEVDVECIEPILKFMEAHPDLDYGSPGPLVHFLELFYGEEEYEEKLIESIGRKPTDITVWMLNRVINDTEEPKRAVLISTMRQAATNPKTDPLTIQEINDFLEYQGRS
jgi:hypothetical protein